MVECNLAKVEVAGSNPVARSKENRGLRHFPQPLFSAGCLVYPTAYPVPFSPHGKEQHGRGPNSLPRILGGVRFPPVFRGMDQSTNGSPWIQTIIRDTFMMKTIVESTTMAVMNMANISSGIYRTREIILRPPCTFLCRPVSISDSLRTAPAASFSAVCLPGIPGKHLIPWVVEVNSFLRV